MHLDWLESYLSRMEKCPLCSGTDWRLLYPLGVLRVHRCKTCSMMFLNPYLSPQGMEKIFSSPELLTKVSAFFADYCGEETWITPRTRQAYGKVLDEALRHAPQRGKLMDIGCGQGAFLKVAKDQGWEPFGIEPNCSKAAELENEHGIKIFQEDFLKAVVPENEYEVVSSWDFIEHLPDPSGLVKRARAMLKQGGLFLVATPNHRSFLDWSAMLAWRLSFEKFTYALSKLYTVDHTLYFTDATLCELLRRDGFEILGKVKVNTDLSRYAMGPAFRLAAEALLGASSLLGLQNRVIVIARNS